jgi:NAD(P)-dependent dehydrogenase (short-subunit alcohol dehydrogenase family)/acyl carrier protein
VATLNRKRPERRSLLEGVARLYVSGGEPDWDAITGPTERVSLPRYPWQRQRHWEESEASRMDRLAPMRHPLLGRRALSPQPTWNIYLSASTPPAFLVDHRVQRSVVFPGAGYIEMALAAAAEMAADRSSGELRVELENVTFENAAFLDEEDAYQLQTSVDTRTLEVRIDGRRDSVQGGDGARAATEGGTWKRHLRCELRLLSATQRDACRLDSVPCDASRASLDVATCYQQLAKQGLDYGPAFRNIASIERTGDGIIARIEASEVLGDVSPYRLHPALLDACFQALLVAGFTTTEGPYLPVGIRRLRLLRPRAGGELTVVARATRADAAALEGDLDIYDASGQLCVELSGVRAVAIERRDRVGAGAAIGRVFTRMLWDRVAPPGAPVVDARGGTCCIFADDAGLWRDLAAPLEAEGCRVVLVRRSRELRIDGRTASLDPSRRDQFARLFGELSNPESPLRSVIYLWGLDGAPNHSLTGQALGDSVRDATNGLLSAAQELTYVTGEPKLWIVTRNAQAVSAADAAPTLTQAPLWGIASTLFYQERRELAGGIVDLPLEATTDDVAALLKLVRVPHAPETHFAIRRGDVLVSRLEPAPEYASGRLVPRMRSDRTYLVTGGLGGLGLLCARWLVERGARRLILLGRTALPERSQWCHVDASSEAGRRILAVRELESLGASVHLAAADVADEPALAKVLAAYRGQQYPAVGGVFHCAGVALPTLLDRLEPGQLLREGDAKILGAWALHRTLADEPLDFFVSFSSAASLGFLMGMTCYAAGNAFLDGLAHFRRAHGLPAMSIDWGPWADVGMAGSDEMTRGFEARGFKMMPPETGLQALDRLFESDPVQPLVMLDCWETLARQNFPGSAPAVMERLTAAQAADDDAASHDQTSVIERLETITDPEERRAVIESALREQVGRVLRMGPETIEPERPLTDVGLDSLMAVELRNRIESALGVKPTMIELLQGASVRALSSALLTRIPRAPAIAGDADLLAALAKMGTDQVESLLARATLSTAEV